MLWVLVVVSMVYVVSVIRNYRYAKRNIFAFSGLTFKDSVKIMSFKRLVFFGVIAGVIAGSSNFIAHWEAISIASFILILVLGAVGLSLYNSVGGKAVLIGMVHNYLPAAMITFMMGEVVAKIMLTNQGIEVGKTFTFPHYIALFFILILLCISFWHSSKRFRDWLDKKVTKRFHNSG